jgi:hypothetical protein
VPLRADIDLVDHHHLETYRTLAKAFVNHTRRLILNEEAWWGHDAAAVFTCDLIFSIATGTSKDPFHSAQWPP